jgi:phage terminase large subunit
MAALRAEGKSYIGCAWIILSCVQHAGVRYLIGRRELTNLKKTTLMTFFQVCKELGLLSDIHYTLNSQLNIINFFNGSQVLLMDMAYKPSDPDYLRFGGLELTGAFCDESNECDLKSIEILKTRIGRCKNDVFSLVPKLLETFNPSKNHIYQRYWVPYKNKQLPEHRIFIPALATDNPYLDHSYIKQLENADEVTRERLLKGNFDFDADDRALVSYPRIIDCFTNSFVPEGEKRLSADLAMQGRDNFVIAIWNGNRVTLPLIKNKARGKEIETDLKQYAEKYHVPRSKVVVDSDGMGGYIESYMEGIVEFHGGSAAFESDKYFNLKSQCAYKLAELINKGELYLDVPEDAYVVVNNRQERLRDVLVAELSQLKKNSVDKDEKLRIIPKEDMKQNLGRSPDLLDVLLMGCMHLCQNTETFVLEDTEGTVF